MQIMVKNFHETKQYRSIQLFLTFYKAGHTLYKYTLNAFYLFSFFVYNKLVLKYFHFN